MRDPFIGDWAGQCADQVQCWVSVERHARSYRVRLTVAQWNDSKRVICRVDGKLRKGEGDYLAGKWGSSDLAGIFQKGADRIRVHGLDRHDCKGTVILNGDYTIIGH